MCGTNWMMMCVAGYCSVDSLLLRYNYHASSCRHARGFQSLIISVLQADEIHLWTTSGMVVVVVWWGVVRKEGVKRETEEGEDESLFLSAPLKLPSQCTPTHFSTLNWGTAAFWHVVVSLSLSHTHERTPTSVAGLWKRVCRRDKSVTQHMPASNNPSYRVSGLHTDTHRHTQSCVHACRSHDRWLYLNQSHMGDTRCRTIYVSGPTD